MSEAIDPVNVIYKFKKDDARATRRPRVKPSSQTAGLTHMDEYKYIIGKIHAIDLMNQELSNLLEPKEPNNDDDNITRIRR